eukprot:CAMPEP_0205950232 /NCGR_PEP_ID=MMETSP1459-20131121/2174_1 /ASSEMBLY_ACC=CAM_ASM_001120 /TAXON_ID=41880 /ORGANISM="Pycnococcus provasolii, Strain RCC931" /LENGTH=81 /DNA_ID=CAMNT_0053321871 /DNA_START=406 /DNA_END=648 /DNA_ORIENTATION=-
MNVSPDSANLATSSSVQPPASRFHSRTTAPATVGLLAISASPRMSTTTAPFAAASASSLAEETAAILSFFLSFWWNKQTGR